MSKQPTNSRPNRWPGKLNVVGRGLTLLFRAVAVLIVFVPAVGKFYQYSHWVAQFESWGLPWPEVAVVASGAVQLAAILLLALGVAGRVGAGSLVVVMTVAIATAGLNVTNAAVLVSSLGIVLLGTGPYSYWDPTASELFERASKFSQRRNIRNYERDTCRER